MGYFPDLFLPASGEGHKTFLLHVNDVGDYVVQRLGPDGRVQSFVAGLDVEDMIRDAASELGGLVLVRVSREGADLLTSWSDYEYKSWAEYLAALNAGDRYARALFAATPSDMLEKYVAGTYGNGKWTYSLTPAAAAWDEEHAPAKDGG